MRFAVIPFLAPAFFLIAGDAPAPRAQFDETAHQAGTILLGQPIRHTYKVTNSGTADLTILDVKPG